MRYTARQLAALLGERAPTAQQAAAIEADPSPLLIIAGAGSGKTTTMAARVVWLVANGHARPEEILGLTFTRKAAAQLARKIRHGIARLGSNPNLPRFHGEPSVSTYHSYASGIVTEHGARIGLEPGGTVLTATRSWQLMYAAAGAHDGDMSQVPLSFDEVVRRALSLSNELAEHLRDGDDLTTFTAQLRDEIASRVERVTADGRKLLDSLQARLQLLPLVDAYRRRKRELGVIDYADQLAQAALVAGTAAEVVRIERRRFPIVLLDEYQDTSHSQVTLLRSLFGDGHAVTAVGDPCQSIYAWRGASAGTLTRFASEFPRRDGEPASRVELTRSWRNRAGILTVANAISRPLRTGSELLPGVEGEGRVDAALLETADDEAGWIADEFAALWPSVEAPSAAVLVRKRAQIPKLEEALRAKGLPVEVIGMGGLMDAPEVREIHATLTVLARPVSGPALLRLLTGPRWRIGPRDIAALHARSRELAPQRRGFEPSDGLSDVSLIEALEDPGDADGYSPAACQRFAALRNELAWLRSRSDQPIAQLIHQVARVSGLDIEAAVHQGGGEKLDAFCDVAAEYSRSASQPTVEGFLSYLDAAEEQERGLELAGAAEHPGAVQIMTVHAAKGLEWDWVAVPGLSQGVFPGKARDTNWLTATGKLPYPLRGDAAELPAFDLDAATSASAVNKAVAAFRADVSAQHTLEERRLAYVALTRARHVLLASGYWWDGEATSPRGPSEFLRLTRQLCEAAAPWAEHSVHESNPLLAGTDSVVWPLPRPLGEAHDDIMAAAEAVRRGEGEQPASERATEWSRMAEMLLAERAQRHDDTIEVPVPRQLSVSQLVSWHADAQQFAAQLRRPLPRRPAPHTRRGTAFHAWIEKHYADPALFDMDDIPGADVPQDDQTLAELREAFLASDWARRRPVAIEVPFTTVVRGVVVRGRMDAVFGDEDGGYQVVDWKTGRPPGGAAARAAAVQLAAYRQAWAALRGVDVARVDAMFHYVRWGRTVRPAQLPGLDPGI